MRVNDITTVNDITKHTIIEIGHVGEENFRDVAFDVGPWIAEHPSATIHLKVLRYGDTVPYPVDLELNGTIAIWHIESQDVAEKGKGKAQLVLTADKEGKNVIGESDVFQIINRYSLGDTGETPDPYFTWFEKLTTLSDKVRSDYNAVRNIKAEMEEELDKIEERTDEEVAQYLAAHRDELKGDPGEPGEPGPPGDDYILTDADRAEIAGLAADAIQPEIDELKSSVSESKVDIGNLESGKVGFTDYAIYGQGGVIKVDPNYGYYTQNGALACGNYNYDQYKTKNDNSFIGKGTLENVLAERLKEPQFEKLFDVTLTEDVKRVDIDASGKKCLALYVKATQSFIIYFNAYNVIAINSDNLTPAAREIFSATQLSASQGVYRGKACIEGGMILGEFTTQPSEAYVASASASRVIRNFAIDGGVFSTVYLWSNTAIPSGTHLEVWGC